MTASGFALFDTAIGKCGIAWGEGGIAGVQLPEADEQQTRKRMLHRFPAAGEAEPPREVRRALESIAALLQGQLRDLSSVTLDMDGVPPFHRRVYEVARTIPRGKTLAYGDIAARLGARGAARAVGQALGQNPFPIVVPCHRVLAAGGKLGGFSAHGGEETKKKILALEGVRLGARSEPLFPATDDAGHGLLYDPAEAARALSDADRPLARLIDRVGPLRLRVTGIQTPF